MGSGPARSMAASTVGRVRASAGRPGRSGSPVAPNGRVRPRVRAGGWIAAGSSFVDAGLTLEANVPCVRRARHATRFGSETWPMASPVRSSSGPPTAGDDWPGMSVWSEPAGPNRLVRTGWSELAGPGQAGPGHAGHGQPGRGQAGCPAPGRKRVTGTWPSSPRATHIECHVHRGSSPRPDGRGSTMNHGRISRTPIQP